MGSNNQVGSVIAITNVAMVAFVSIMRTKPTSVQGNQKGRVSLLKKSFNVLTAANEVAHQSNERRRLLFRNVIIVVTSMNS